MTAAVTNFFPYMCELDFIPNDDTRTLLKVAMRAANENNLHEFLATNRDGYCVPHVLKILMPISNALDSECSVIMERSCDGGVTYFMIIGMLECIARDGIDVFAAKFDINNRLLDSEFNMTDILPPPPLVRSESDVMSRRMFRLGELVDITYCNNNSRGKIVQVISPELYVVQDIYTGKDDEYRGYNLEAVEYDYLPSNADFSFITDQMTRSMIESGYRGVMKTEGWLVIRNFTGESFMFTKDKQVNRIMTAVNNEYGGGHSGASIGYTMRMLERISHVSFNSFKTEWLENQEEAASRR